jgi:hypothetical protein
MVYRTIKSHGAAGIAAPPGPDFHQFSDAEFADEMLSKARFSRIETSIVECGWTLGPGRVLSTFLREAPSVPPCFWRGSRLNTMRQSGQP